MRNFSEGERYKVVAQLLPAAYWPSMVKADGGNSLFRLKEDTHAQRWGTMSVTFHRERETKLLAEADGDNSGSLYHHMCPVAVDFGLCCLLMCCVLIVLCSIKCLSCAYKLFDILHQF